MKQSCDTARTRRFERYISCFKLMVIETSYLCRGGLQVVGYISCLRLMVIETGMAAEMKHSMSGYISCLRLMVIETGFK